MAFAWAAKSLAAAHMAGHAARHTGSGGIPCGIARHGQTCAEEPNLPGAWDPNDPLRPH
jgi:hypothetical protein